MVLGRLRCHRLTAHPIQIVIPCYDVSVPLQNSCISKLGTCGNFFCNEHVPRQSVVTLLVFLVLPFGTSCKKDHVFWRYCIWALLHFSPGPTTTQWCACVWMSTGVEMCILYGPIVDLGAVLFHWWRATGQKLSKPVPIHASLHRCGIYLCQARARSPKNEKRAMAIAPAIKPPNRCDWLTTGRVRANLFQLNRFFNLSCSIIVHQYI